MASVMARALPKPLARRRHPRIFADDSLVSLVQKCHEALRPTRGVVLSLALIDFQLGTLTWLGIGNVQGVLIRSTISET